MEPQILWEALGPLLVDVKFEPIEIGLELGNKFVGFIRFGTEDPLGPFHEWLPNDIGVFFPLGRRQSVSLIEAGGTTG